MTYPVNTYEVGETVIITGIFMLNGELGDPVNVRFIYKNPEDEITTLIYPENTEITNISPGIYSIELHLDTPGFWYYRVDDNSSNVAVEKSIQVRASKLIPDTP